MSGSVITQSRTTLGLDVPTPAFDGRYATTPSLPQVDAVKVYPAGPSASAEAVIVDLLRNLKVRPVDGGGTIAERSATFALTRDEALNLIRAIQRSLGIDPDALVRALDMVYAADGSSDPADADEAYRAVADAASVLIGHQPADQRS